MCVWLYAQPFGGFQSLSSLSQKPPSVCSFLSLDLSSLIIKVHHLSVLPLSPAVVLSHNSLSLLVHYIRLCVYIQACCGCVVGCRESSPRFPLSLCRAVSLFLYIGMLVVGVYRYIYIYVYIHMHRLGYIYTYGCMRCVVYMRETKRNRSIRRNREELVHLPKSISDGFRRTKAACTKQERGGRKA